MAIGNRINSNLNNTYNPNVYVNVNNIIFENGEDSEDSEDSEYEEYENNDSEEEKQMIENEYDPEEESNSKYNLVLCCPTSFLSNNQFMVFTRFKKYNQKYITDQIKYHFLFYKNINNNKYNRDEFLSQWKNPQIVEVIYTEKNEVKCILKTFWLKIFQRHCKKYLLQKEFLNI
jgi:hypothetical protein